MSEPLLRQQLSDPERSAIHAFLVEDQPDVSDALIEGMEDTTSVRFVGLATTESGATDWLAANDGQWDLAIIDLFLNEGSGFGVLKDCQDRSPRQKVVVLTSYIDDRVLERCRALGADEVFDKSLDVEKLVEYCASYADNLESMDPSGLITESQPMPLDMPPYSESVADRALRAAY